LPSKPMPLSTTFQPSPAPIWAIKALTAFRIVPVETMIF